jgi:Dolichyl-phosphate-mannose-protein mannosyltransferase
MRLLDSSQSDGEATQRQSWLSTYMQGDKRPLGTKLLYTFCLVGMFLAVIYLSVTGLAHTYFWDDEAHVAIIARNVLATGHLTAWDGRNLHAYRNGSVLDKNLRQLGPPLDSLLVAGSFRLFGSSTWAGRLPFVVVGLTSLAIFWLLVHHDFGPEKPTCLYAVSVLGFSPIFLLNIRQCRYYALSLLFSLLAFYAYRRCLATKRLRHFIGLAGASVLLFYSNYFLCVAFLLSLGVVHGMFYGRHFESKEWGKVALAIALFAVATVPHVERVLHYPDLGQGGSWIARRLTLWWWNMRDLNLLACLPWTIAVGLFYVLLRYRQSIPTARIAWQWVTFSVAFVAFVALFSPQPTTVSTIADIRYLIIVVPFLAGLAGIFLGFVHQRMQVLACTLLTVLVTTNVLTFTPFERQFRWLLPAYIGEIHRAYPTSYEAAVAFLNKYAAPDDVVFTSPEYTHPPLIFYVGEKVRVCCLLNYHTRLPRATVHSLSAPLFIEEQFPQWFVAFGNHPQMWELLHFFSRSHQRDNKTIRFSYPLVEVLDVYWRATHRPELPWHTFGPKTNFDRRAEAVYIFQRTENVQDDKGSHASEF